MKELSIYNPIPSSLVSSYQSYKNYVFSLPTLSEEDESFMVTYGDGVSDLNVKKELEFHKKQGTGG